MEQVDYRYFSSEKLTLFLSPILYSSQKSDLTTILQRGILKFLVTKLTHTHLKSILSLWLFGTSSILYLCSSSVLFIARLDTFEILKDSSEKRAKTVCITLKRGFKNLCSFFLNY